MLHRILAAFALTALLSGCAHEHVATRKGAAYPVVSGVITGIGGHGNAYTSIRSSSYDSLGLRAGGQILLAFPDTSFSLLLGEGYTAVPSGEPVAVLHPEGLTLAVRDGELATRFSVAAGDSFRIFATAAPKK